jgi:hypothetical protein
MPPAAKNTTAIAVVAAAYAMSARVRACERVGALRRETSASVRSLRFERWVGSVIDRSIVHGAHVGVERIGPLTGIRTTRAKVTNKNKLIFSVVSRALVRSW